MQDFIMEGVSSINGGEFDKIKINGVGSCKSKIKAVSFHIEGVFNCSGEVEAEELYCEGVANMKANIRAKKIYIGGMFSEKAQTRIEAEEITCDGCMKTGGEISVDMLNAQGCIEAEEIVGDRIRILTYGHQQGFFSLTRTVSRVRTIEATTIEISGVKADTVNGNDITIGPGCRVENVDCSGVLYIDNSSFVKNITGNYVRKDSEYAK